MGKSRKFEGVGRAGKAMTHTPRKFPGTGRVWDKNVLPRGGGGMNIFRNYTILTVSQGVKPWGKACVQAIHFEWRAKRSVRERTRPSLSFRVLLAFALHDICLREFAHRLWWDGPVSMFCNKGISVSRSLWMYYKDMWSYLIIWTLPPSSDHKPAKKGNSLSLKREPTFQRKKNVAYILEAVFVVVVVWNVR